MVKYSVPDLFPLTVSSVSENENDSTPETAQSQSVFDHNAMLRYVDALPDVAGASIFGLHDNANVSRMKFESLQLLDTWLPVLPAAGSSGADGVSGGGGARGGESGEVKGPDTESAAASPQSREEMISVQAGEILARFPEERLYEVDKIRRKFPTLYLESYNSVLVQGASGTQTCWL